MDRPLTIRDIVKMIEMIKSWGYFFDENVRRYDEFYDKFVQRYPETKIDFEIIKKIGILRWVKNASIEDIELKLKEVVHGNNVAFKCTYNDAGFQGICSKKNRQINVDSNRIWCTDPTNECEEMINKGKKGYPCYESRIFVDYMFGAGYDTVGKNRGRPRTLRHVKNGKLAIFTTILPNDDESERYIFGIFDIEKFETGDSSTRNLEMDSGDEGRIYGSKETAIKINPNIRLKFWDFHINQNAPNSKKWGFGLVRYLNDEEVHNILTALKSEYEKRGIDNKEIMKIDRLIERYNFWISKT